MQYPLMLFRVIKAPVHIDDQTVGIRDYALCFQEPLHSSICFTVRQLSSANVRSDHKLLHRRRMETYLLTRKTETRSQTSFVSCSLGNIQSGSLGDIIEYMMSVILLFVFVVENTHIRC